MGNLKGPATQTLPLLAPTLPLSDMYGMKYGHTDAISLIHLDMLQGPIYVSVGPRHKPNDGHGNAVSQFNVVIKQSQGSIDRIRETPLQVGADTINRSLRWLVQIQVDLLNSISRAEGFF